MFKFAEEISTSRYEALLQVSEAISLHRDIPALFQDIVRRLHAVVDFEFIKFALSDELKDVMRLHILKMPEAVSDPLEIEFSLDESPGALAWRTQQPFVIPKVEQETRFPRVMDLLRREGVSSFCVIPLTTSHRRLGALGFGSRNPEAYSESDLDFMVQVTKQVAVAVDNVLNLAQVRSVQQQLVEQRDRLQLLLNLNNAVVNIRDLRKLFGTIAEEMQGLFHHTWYSLALCERDRCYVRLHALMPPDTESRITDDVVIPASGIPAGIAINSGKPFSFTKHDLHQFDSEFARGLLVQGVEAGCCIPLMTREEVIGTLNLARRTNAALTPEEMAILSQIASQIAIAVENGLAFSQVQQLKNQLAEEKRYLEEEIRTAYNCEEIMGDSAQLKRVLSQVGTVAPTNSTVLITGETGTGKELIARAVHNLSPRRTRTFVKINCAAIPTGLLESELFGHERGAFTGAITRKAGRFELAHQGTLFLDEIGDIPLELQSKLLRVLQEQEFERLGGTKTIHVEVRLIAATNRDLKKMVDQGLFRSDLYYRLNVFPIMVPPLREHKEDIPLLVRYFAYKYANQMNKEIVTIPADALDALSKYYWPGNIRELQNLIERAVILSKGPTLQVPINELESTPPTQMVMDGSTLHDVERTHIIRILHEAKWVISGPSGAALRLGMKRSTLLSRMQKLAIVRPQ